MGILIVFVAFGSIYGITSLFGIDTDAMDIRVTMAFFVISCVVVYGMSFGAFAGVQRDSCGAVKSWKQVAINAAIPLAFQAVILSVVMLIPWFRNIVGNMFPPDTPEVAKVASAFAYYSFWAVLMGGALGGTLSGSCKVDETAVFDFDTNKVLEIPSENEGTDEVLSELGNLPAE